MSEPMSGAAWLLILLIIFTTFFGKKGKHRGYTRRAPQPPTGSPRPDLPGKKVKTE